MRAWKIQRHGEPRDVLALVEAPVPAPGPGDLRVRVETAGLGFPDVLMCRGTYVFQPVLPFTPGQEVCGIVTAAGPGTAIPVGARVMGVTAFFKGLGGLADEALALDASMYPAPDAMDAGNAAGFVIPYHTAYLALVTRGRLLAGETLLVLGAAGGSGSGAVALGRALGARVIAVAGGAEKAALCERLGAHHVIDSGHDDLPGAVRAANSGRGVDVVFDPVGGDAFGAGLECLANQGRLLAIGYASGGWRDASTQQLVGRNVSVVGVFVGAYQKPLLSRVHDELIAHWHAGRIPSLVSRHVGFAQAADALQDLAERRARGKVIVRVTASGV